jgi:hypothetical protein
MQPILVVGDRFDAVPIQLFKKEIQRSFAKSPMEKPGVPRMRWVAMILPHTRYTEKRDVVWGVSD